MGPSTFQVDRLRSLAGNLQERRWELLETPWEIGKDFRRNLSFAPLRPENARDGQKSPASVLRQCLSRRARLSPLHVRKAPIPESPA